MESSGSGSRKSRLTAVGILCADHAVPSVRKNLALTLLTSRSRSVGIVRLRTKATEFSSLVLIEKKCDPRELYKMYHLASELNV
jgi:hypothetical protein